MLYVQIHKYAFREYTTALFFKSKMLMLIFSMRVKQQYKFVPYI